MPKYKKKFLMKNLNFLRRLAENNNPVGLPKMRPLLRTKFTVETVHTRWYYFITINDPVFENSM